MNPASELLSSLTEMAQLNINETPSYRTFILLKNALIKCGFERHVAWTIATSVKIDVNDAGVNNPQFTKIIQTYADIIDIMFCQICNDLQADGLSVDRAESLITKAASEFAITLVL